MAEHNQLLGSLGRRITKEFKNIQWALLALGVILLFNLIVSPDFFQIGFRNGRMTGSVIDVLKRAAPRMIIALGMTLVIGSGGIDVSVGSLAAIAGSVAVLVIRGGDITYLVTQATSTVPIPLIVFAALLVVAALGAFNGFLVSVIQIQPIIATLILMVTGRGMAMLLTNGYVLAYDHPQYESLGAGGFLGLPIPVWFALGVLVLLSLLSNRTPLGLYIQATGGNPTASYYSGTRTQLVKLLVYVISALCAGVAGIIFTADVKSADAAFMGLWIELEAILAVVIGGTPMTGGRYSLLGTVVGALIIQTLITTLLTMAVPVQYTLIFQAIVVIIVLILQSDKVKDATSRKRTFAAPGVEHE
jgi:galactofuranose transport system permease protein